MQKIDFSCTLLSDVVIHADANTEGNVPVHDYIPGSNFLGIVARDYEGFGEAAFDIFHGGNVRFGDAHPILEGAPSLRPPLSWHHAKGFGVTDEPLYNILKMSEVERKELVGRNVQLKQLRNGFFSPETKKYMAVSHRYSQKSAYDSAKRRSEEGAMFGYSSLSSGLVFGFSVFFGEGVGETLLDRIIARLEGEHTLGKSRSAQYGRVRIRRAETGWRDAASTEGEERTMYIYARSRLAFVDAGGHPTLQPDAALLKLPEGAAVNWNKSQIRTGSFASYNGARRTRDYRRYFIDKGSVIVVEGLPDDFDSGTWLDEQGAALGVWRSEGFGEVLINPAFLNDMRVALNGKEKPKTSAVKRRENKHLSKWLDQRHDRKEKEMKLLEDVKHFIDTHIRLYAGVNPSQWGAVRAFCRYGDYLKKTEEYIEKGTASKEQWAGERKKVLFDALKEMDQDRGRLFLQLLATEMAKAARRQRRNA